LIDFNSLQKSNNRQNLELAFSVGQKLGIPRLLDVEDLVSKAQADEKSVMTYISEVYHFFEVTAVEQKKREDEERRRMEEDESSRKRAAEDEIRRKIEEEEREIERLRRLAADRDALLQSMRDSEIKYQQQLFGQRATRGRIEEDAVLAKDYFDSDSSDGDLQLFHGNTAVTKKPGTSNRHVSASTFGSYTSGTHYFEFKVIKSSNNRVFFGVQEESKQFSPYPGHMDLKTGTSLGADGSLYAEGKTQDALLPFGAGDYVGVLLSMETKSVTFSVNGILTPTVDLTGSTYSFIANVYTAGDAVEIVLKFCYHRQTSLLSSSTTTGGDANAALSIDI